jgi:hypothetical protein
MDSARSAGPSDLASRPRPDLGSDRFAPAATHPTEIGVPTAPVCEW